MTTPDSKETLNFVYNPSYPGRLEAVFHHAASEDMLLTQLLAVLGDLLQCDCCFFYLRHPQRHQSKITHYWSKSSQYPTLIDERWHLKDKRLANSDLFSAALSMEHSAFINNIDAESANLRATDPFIRNEQALVQGHIFNKDQLWGILRACVFQRPRSWMQFDRSMIIHSVQKLVPHVINYIEAEAP